MLLATVFGYLGADAEVKNANGNEFVTFRVANTDRWTDAAGQVHETTIWVDCLMSGKSKVFDYLKKGQLIYASGSISLRVYSSAKDKCMKAGLTLNIRQVELLGGKSGDVPSTLYTAEGHQEVRVSKFYNAPVDPATDGIFETRQLVSTNGKHFVQDKNGWIYPMNESAE